MEKIIKVTKLEIRLLNEIVNEMYDGGAQNHEEYKYYRSLTQSEKGVMSSLIKKQLIDPYEYHEANGFETAMVLPTDLGIVASIKYHKMKYGNQSSEFKAQFEFDTDLEYLEDLKTWFNDRENIIEPNDARFSFFEFVEFDNTKEVEKLINQTFNKTVDAKTILEHEKFYTTLKNQYKMTFMWNEETAMDFASFYANKNKSEFGQFIGEDACKKAISKKAKMELFKANWNAFVQYSQSKV